MGEHKYKEAWKEGFDCGVKATNQSFVYQCFDELSAKERLEELAKLGVTVSAVQLALKQLREEITDLDYIDVPDGADCYEQPIDRCAVLHVIDNMIKEYE